MEIKGTLDFTISVDDKKKIFLSYNQNIENDLGSMAVAAATLDTMKAHFDNMKAQFSKDKKTAKQLKETNTILLRISKGKMAMDALVSYNLAMYEDWCKYKDSMKKQQEEKEAANAKD